MLNWDITRHVFSNQNRFFNWINFENSYCIANQYQLAIKGKKIIYLLLEDIILRLLDELYISDFIVNLISIAKF